MDWTCVKEWLPIIGNGIGIPAALWGMVNLFRRDKDKERKLNSLEDLARTQKNQIQELAKQTAQFSAQTELMKEANHLTNKNLEATLDHYFQVEATAKQEQELLELKRRDKIKPNLILENSVLFDGEFQISLKNIGGDMKNVSFKDVKIHKAMIEYPDVEGKEYFKDNIIEITGTPDFEESLDVKEASIHFQIYYMDVDHNKYFQAIDKVGFEFKVNSPRPILN